MKSKQTQLWTVAPAANGLIRTLWVRLGNSGAHPQDGLNFARTSWARYLPCSPHKVTLCLRMQDRTWRQAPRLKGQRSMCGPLPIMGAGGTSRVLCLSERPCCVGCCETKPASSMVWRLAESIGTLLGGVWQRAGRNMFVGQWIRRCAHWPVPRPDRAGEDPEKKKIVKKKTRAHRPGDPGSGVEAKSTLGARRNRGCLQAGAR